MVGRLLEWFIVSVLARWFPSRYRELRRADDRVFFRQFKVFSFGAEQSRGTPPWWHMSCLLQSFLLGDDADVFHIHRWRREVSFVLSGELVEERDNGKYISHTAPAVYTMGSSVVHRAHSVAPRTWTLFFMFGRNKFTPKAGWGYWRRISRPKWDDYQPWNEVRSEEVKPL